MSVLAPVLGVVAIAGLVLASKLRALAPMFLLCGVAVSLLAVVATLVRNPVAAALLAMMLVPYWAAWLFVYTVFGVSPRHAGAGEGAGS